jgi:preprotein translocase subunit SecA
MFRLGMTEGVPIESRLISKRIENAQKAVEAQNFEARKHLLEYDDVMNKQREVIYAERRRILQGESVRDFMLQTLRTKIEDAIDQNAPENVHPSEWDLETILTELEPIFPVKASMTVEDLEKLDREEMAKRLYEVALAAYEAKEQEITPELMRVIETQYIMLTIIDRLWVDHLYVMDALKTGIGLRGYGQKDPRVEYEKEAYEIFEDLKSNIADEAIKAVFHVHVDHTAPSSNGEPAEAALVPPEDALTGALPAFEPIPHGSLAPQPSRVDPVVAQKLLGPVPGAEQKRDLHTNREQEQPKKPARTEEKIGRNELCPCGSGKKYKKCHGAAA